MPQNVMETDATNDVATWRIRVTCWMSKATCTHDHAQAYVHSHSPEHMHVRARARARTHTHTHTHTQIYNIYCFSTLLIIRKRPSVLFIITLSGLFRSVERPSQIWSQPNFSSCACAW
jgi:ABC-type nickel/cobalt efflux system permease component RcnA